MKVAFCYSGMFRNFDKNLENHISNLTSKYDSDFYLSFWDMQGIGDFKNRLDSDPNIIDDEIKSYIENKLKPNFIEFQNFEPISQSFDNIERKIKPDLNPPFIKNILSMYYKIKRCSDMVSKSGIDYDIVVRLRPDIYFNSSMRLENPKENSLYANNDGNWGDAYNDQFYYGNQKTMEIVGDLYSNLYHIWETTNVYQSPEGILWTFLQQKEINVSKVVMDYYLIRH